MTDFKVTKVSKQSAVNGGNEYSVIYEYGWKCTCGKRSVWFPTPARRDEAKRRHEQAHFEK